MVGPNREEVIGDGRKLHNYVLSDFYSSPKIIRMVNSRSRRCVGHVEYVGRIGMYTCFGGGNKKERNHCEVLGIEGRIILK
jgi:hypothetical protein